MRNLLLISISLLTFTAKGQLINYLNLDTTAKDLLSRQNNVLEVNWYMKNQLHNPKNFRTWLNLSAQPLQYYLYGDTTLVDSLLDIVYPKAANYNATWDSVVKNKLGIK